ncbi:unnamed protein product, partial [Choristocarpus tenellus]
MGTKGLKLAHEKFGPELDPNSPPNRPVFQDPSPNTPTPAPTLPPPPTRPEAKEAKVPVHSRNPPVHATRGSGAELIAPSNRRGGESGGVGRRGDRLNALGSPMHTPDQFTASDKKQKALNLQGEVGGGMGMSRSHKRKASRALTEGGGRGGAGGEGVASPPAQPGRQSSRRKKLTAIAQEAVDSGQMKLNYMSFKDSPPEQVQGETRPGRQGKRHQGLTQGPGQALTPVRAHKEPLQQGQRGEIEGYDGSVSQVSNNTQTSVNSDLPEVNIKHSRNLQSPKGDFWGSWNSGNSPGNGMWASSRAGLFTGLQGKEGDDDNQVHGGKGGAGMGPVVSRSVGDIHGAFGGVRDTPEEYMDDMQATLDMMVDPTQHLQHPLPMGQLQGYPGHDREQLSRAAAGAVSLSPQRQDGQGGGRPGRSALGTGLVGPGIGISIHKGRGDREGGHGGIEIETRRPRFGLENPMLSGGGNATSLHNRSPANRANFGGAQDAAAATARVGILGRVASAPPLESSAGVGGKGRDGGGDVGQRISMIRRESPMLTAARGGERHGGAGSI